MSQSVTIIMSQCVILTALQIWREVSLQTFPFIIDQQVLEIQRDAVLGSVCLLNLLVP